MTLAARLSTPPDQPDAGLAPQTNVTQAGFSTRFVGRQAIYDRKLAVKAYELLYRSGPAGPASFLDGTAATADVLATSLVDIGLDKLADNKQVYINVNREFLLGPDSLPVAPQQVMLEILEDVTVDDALVDAVAKLSAEGFSFALDDFVGGSQWEALMPYVSVIKIDVRALTLTEIERELTRLASFKVRLLAEKVETQDEFEALSEMGFELFQGFFLSRPVVVEGQRLPATKRSLIELLAAVRDPKVDTGTLVRLIERDVGLSVRLMRLLNSAQFLLPQEVTSVGRAVVLLGLDGVKRWASLICLAGGDILSPELMRLSLVRAKMCELLFDSIRPADASAGFTMGLFSNLDCLMQATLEDALSEIPLKEEVRDALLHNVGPFYPILACVLACERYEPERLSLVKLDAGRIQTAFGAANRWSDDVIRQLGLG
jgi:EAL and modified HD-GYP domain-containing signal transduction protein